MSKCDLEVQFDEDQREYAIGDTVTGKVIVKVNAECQCDGLSLSHFWRTHGRGNTDQGTPESQALFVGRWYPRETHEYPFSFIVQAGPLTYHGHDLNVDWYARATADIPWAIDPKGEEDFIVHQGDYRGVIDQGKVTALELGETGYMMARGLLMLFLLPFALVGLFTLGKGLLELLDGNLIGLGLVVFGTVFLGVTMKILFKILKKTIAETILGPVIMTLDTNSLYPGDNIQVNLNCTPRRHVKVTTLKAALVARERVVSGSGTNAQTHTHELFEEETIVASQLRMQRGMTQHFATSLALTHGSPPSFGAPSNNLEYKIKVEFDLPGWPDWSK